MKICNIYIVTKLHSYYDRYGKSSQHILNTSQLWCELQLVDIIEIFFLHEVSSPFLGLFTIP